MSTSPKKGFVYLFVVCLAVGLTAGAQATPGPVGPYALPCEDPLAFPNAECPPVRGEAKPRYEFITHGQLVDWWGPGTPLRNGAAHGCAKFGAVCNWWGPQSPEGSPEAMDEQREALAAAIASAPAGIATTVLGGDEEYGNLILQALDAGIPVVTFNVADFHESFPETKVPPYIGPKLVTGGQALAKASLDQLEALRQDPLAPLSVQNPASVMIFTFSGVPWSDARAEGMQQFFGSAGVSYHVQDLTPFWVDFDAFAHGVWDSLRGLAQVGVIPNIILVTWPNWNYELLDPDSPWWAPAPEDVAGIGPSGEGYGVHDVVHGGFDLGPWMAELMDFGYSYVTIDQQPYLQGYLPVVQLHLANRAAFSGWDVDTGGGVVNQGNIHQIVPLMEAGIR